MFLLKEERVVSTHAHCQYIGANSIERFRTLGNTAEVFEFSHTNIPFVNECGHVNYVYFTMLITWMSGRGHPMDRNY